LENIGLIEFIVEAIDKRSQGLLSVIAAIVVLVGCAASVLGSNGTLWALLPPFIVVLVFGVGFWMVRRRFRAPAASAEPPAPDLHGAVAVDSEGRPVGAPWESYERKRAELDEQWLAKTSAKRDRP
jgi:hypothetical protein